MTNIVVCMDLWRGGWVGGWTNWWKDGCANRLMEGQTLRLITEIIMAYSYGSVWRLVPVKWLSS